MLQSYSPEMLSYHIWGPKQITGCVLLNECSKGRNHAWTSFKDRTSFVNSMIVLILVSYPGLQSVILNKLL